MKGESASKPAECMLKDACGVEKHSIICGFFDNLPQKVYYYIESTSHIHRLEHSNTASLSPREDLLSRGFGKNASTT